MNFLYNGHLMEAYQVVFEVDCMSSNKAHEQIVSIG